ncbi:hypothetical protein NPX13_g4971 [Xylaria arbuscula]|uniref:Ubiquitin-like protease family profile domain-containing protein n=1 Tax=Xylaria arbuscula TaxID=114810 RepID=A0A9W8NEI4_9PEZI|nr:hypothetical protein NPX13_g4971 [Xylaria arbuscula]
MSSIPTTQHSSGDGSSDTSSVKLISSKALEDNYEAVKQRLQCLEEKCGWIRNTGHRVDGKDAITDWPQYLQQQKGYTVCTTGQPDLPGLVILEKVCATQLPICWELGRLTRRRRVSQDYDAWSRELAKCLEGFGVPIAQVKEPKDGLEAASNGASIHTGELYLSDAEIEAGLQFLVKGTPSAYLWPGILTGDNRRARAGDTELRKAMNIQSIRFVIAVVNTSCSHWSVLVFDKFKKVGYIWDSWSTGAEQRAHISRRHFLFMLYTTGMKERDLEKVRWRLAPVGEQCRDWTCGYHVLEAVRSFILERGLLCPRLSVIYSQVKNASPEEIEMAMVKNWILWAARCVGLMGRSNPSATPQAPSINPNNRLGSRSLNTEHAGKEPSVPALPLPRRPNHGTMTPPARQTTQSTPTSSAVRQGLSPSELVAFSNPWHRVDTTIHDPAKYLLYVAHKAKLDISREEAMRYLEIAKKDHHRAALGIIYKDTQWDLTKGAMFGFKNESMVSLSSYASALGLVGSLFKSPTDIYDWAEDKLKHRNYIQAVDLLYSMRRRYTSSLLN